jgi:hypothetical protein
METVAEATERLRRDGFDGHWTAVGGGRLRCSECGGEYAADTVTVDEVVRFEGASDPADEAILYALTGPCEHRGIYVAAYGPDASPDDVEAETALRMR